jgi:hypothetical protein
LLAKATEILQNMSTVEWIVAVALALMLAVAVVQQLAKTALVAVALIALGVFLMNGRIENWSF